MYCNCRVTDFADTRIPGSDEFEMIAWLLGRLPGWLYCAASHVLRGKLCTHCERDRYPMRLQERIVRRFLAGY
jgi:hypothetical protein